MRDDFIPSKLAYVDVPLLPHHNRFTPSQADAARVEGRDEAGGSGTLRAGEDKILKRRGHGRAGQALSRRRRIHGLPSLILEPPCEGPGRAHGGESERGSAKLTATRVSGASAELTAVGKSRTPAMEASGS